MTLRPYQEKGRTELREALRNNRAAIYCLPCGGGKGTICSVMVHGAVASGRHVVFAVHGKALVHDMSRRVSNLGIKHGVLMGSQRRERNHAVQVASVDTWHRMAHPPKADLIIIDEARTFLSETGRKVLSKYPNAKIVGLDATPLRSDGKGLGVEHGGIFDVMVMGPTEQELIDLEYLVPSIPIGIENPPDMSKAKVGADGEFKKKQAAEICKTATRVGDIVEHWLREAAGRKTVAFAIDCADARDITAQFLKAGIEWAYVDANTPDDERQKIWDALDYGTLMGFSNVGIAGCGWDHPVVSCVISAAPRHSLSAWRQEIGRGSRIHPASGKKDFIILDHSGNLKRHFPYGHFEVPPIWSLSGAEVKEKEGDSAPVIATCKIPILVPETGVPSFFKGPLSVCGKYMLPSYHTFRAGPDICPYCGIPLRMQGREIEVEAGRLTNLAEDRERARIEAKRLKLEAQALKTPFQLAEEEKKKMYYLEMVQKSRDKGYKPGFALVQFKSRYGTYPSKALKAEALEMVTE